METDFRCRFARGFLEQFSLLDYFQSSRLSANEADLILCHGDLHRAPARESRVLQPKPAQSYHGHNDFTSCSRFNSVANFYSAARLPREFAFRHSNENFLSPVRGVIARPMTR